MAAVMMLDTNAPKYAWDIVGEHCSLINAKTQSCPTDSSVTIYEAESGMIPDLDKIPPSGCFGIMYPGKLGRNDFKFLPKNQAGKFLGFTILSNGTHGSVFLNSDRRLVEAKETMDFIHDCFPPKEEPSSNPEYVWVHNLFRRNRSPKKNLTTQDAEDMQGNGEIVALDPSQESEKKRSFSLCSSSSDADDDSDAMNFDNEVLDALAHLNSWKLYVLEFFSLDS